MKEYVQGEKKAKDGDREELAEESQISLQQTENWAFKAIGAVPIPDRQSRITSL